MSKRVSLLISLIFFKYSIIVSLPEVSELISTILSAISG